MDAEKTTSSIPMKWKIISAIVAVIVCVAVVLVPGVIVPAITEQLNRFGSSPRSAQRLAEPIDLSGLWRAEGYWCNGKANAETIQVKQSGEQVEAVKMSGDGCIMEGEITFTATIDPYQIFPWQSKLLPFRHIDLQPGTRCVL